MGADIFWLCQCLDEVRTIAMPISSTLKERERERGKMKAIEEGGVLAGILERVTIQSFSVDRLAGQ